jgi:protein-disulfide isomerase/uncharacterized membrane protein
MQKTWRLGAVTALCLLGTVVSVYLTAIHLRHLQTGEDSACNFSQTLNCDAVLSSQWSEIARIPVSQFGTLFYLGMGALAVLGLLSAGLRSRLQGYLLIGALLACGCSLFLGGVSLTLHAACVFCMTTYAVNLALLVLLSPGGGSALRTVFSDLGADVRGLLRPGRLLPLLLALGIAAASTYALRGHSAQAHASATQRQLSVQQSLIDASAPTLGPAQAPITLIEISDFECPFCRRATETIAELRRLYPDKLRVVFRNFPLDEACNPLLKHPLHDNACAAARAAVCAGEQGQFWPYAEKLFTGELEAADLLAYAKALGLQEPAFTACQNASATAARVAADIAACTQAGVKAVPVFFINGRRLAGAKPLEDFREIIDEELASSTGKR